MHLAFRDENGNLRGSDSPIMNDLIASFAPN